MSNVPPPLSMQNAYAYPPARQSALAIVSLVTGILGCLVITPFVAIVTGILGIRATRDPAVRGRGMAVAGLVLGLVWLLGFAATGAGVGVFLKNSQAPVDVARQFTADVIAGDYAAASAASKGIGDAQLVALHDTLAAWGANTDITLPNRNANKTMALTRWTLTGTATFATGGVRQVTYVVDSDPAGGYRVAAADFK